jgi:glycosyltransferase involved in cell wall biosynthesis
VREEEAKALARARHLPNARTALDADTLKRAFADHLHYSQGKDEHTATALDRYFAVAYSVRDRLMRRWIETQQAYYKRDAKRVYYLSLEFLMGRALVIAGGAEAGTAGLLARLDRPPLAGRVEYRGYVGAAEREALFKGALALVLPSFDEGFGIPALEAMSAGVPVVVSNRAALPEVVGDAGLYIDPDDVESLTAALGRVIADPQLCADLRRRGLDRASRFTWTDSARAVRRAYEDALLTRRHRAHALAGAPPGVHSRNAHRH